MTPEESRAAAELAYTSTAFDYVRDPIVSRDWVIYWQGWQAAMQARTSAEQPAQGEKSCEHGTVPAGMTCEVCYVGWNAGRRGPPHPPLAAPSKSSEQPAQGEAVAQIVDGELMWFIPHQSYALDTKFRLGRWMLYTAPPAPSDWRIESRLRDLLHLLEHATITTPSPGDAHQARKAIDDLRNMLASGGKASVPDELREVIRDACREWQNYVEVDTAPMSCRDYVMREIDAWLAAAPEAKP